MSDNWKELMDALKEACDFKGLEPTEVETNLGGVWFKDKNSGKMQYILIDECAEG